MKIWIYSQGVGDTGGLLAGTEDDEEAGHDQRFVLLKEHEAALGAVLSREHSLFSRIARVRAIVDQYAPGYGLPGKVNALLAAYGVDFAFSDALVDLLRPTAIPEPRQSSDSSKPALDQPAAGPGSDPEAAPPATPTGAAG
jgi:hypothetical protein